MDKPGLLLGLGQYGGWRLPEWYWCTPAVGHSNGMDSVCVQGQSNAGMQWYLVPLPVCKASQICRHLEALSLLFPISWLPCGDCPALESPQDSMSLPHFVILFPRGRCWQGLPMSSVNFCFFLWLTSTTTPLVWGG